MNVSFSQNRAFHPEGDSWNYSQIRQIRRFEGVRFLPNSPTLGPMHASHVTNPREANLDESEGDTWTSHGLKGPRVGKSPQNQVDTGNWRKSPHDSHHEEAHLEWGPQGVGRPHRSASFLEHTFPGIFLGAISRPFSLGFGWGCMLQPFVVLFPLIPLPNPWAKGLDFGVFLALGFEAFLVGFLRFLSI
jgi:hypothetical protein